MAASLRLARVTTYSQLRQDLTALVALEPQTYPLRQRVIAVLEKEFRDFLRELGARVRHLRQDLDLTIESASERAGLHPSYWSQCERSVKMPSIQSLFKICQALNVTVADLLTLESTPRPDAVARELGQILREAAPKHAKTVIEIARSVMSLPGAREPRKTRSSASVR